MTLTAFYSNKTQDDLPVAGSVTYKFVGYASQDRNDFINYPFIPRHCQPAGVSLEIINLQAPISI
jgi:hypothetical protein